MKKSSPRKSKQANQETPSPGNEFFEVETLDSQLTPDLINSNELENAKPLHYIIQNLERAYGAPAIESKSDALDMLVRIVLSQATSDINSDRAYTILKQRFPSYEKLLRAAPATLEATIRGGGLAKQKSATILNFLKQLKETRGKLSLDFLDELSTDEAVAFLQNFRGIGPKTIACTLLFALNRSVFPLDTHIFRILRRVGILPAKCSDTHAHNLMNEIVPDGKHLSFHVNLIRHGRTLCRPRNPACERCPIVEYCDYGQAMI